MHYKPVFLLAYMMTASVYHICRFSPMLGYGTMLMPPRGSLPSPPSMFLEDASKAKLPSERDRQAKEFQRLIVSCRVCAFRGILDCYGALL